MSTNAHSTVAIAIPDVDLLAFADILVILCHHPDVLFLNNVSFHSVNHYFF